MFYVHIVEGGEEVKWGRGEGGNSYNYFFTV